MTDRWGRLVVGEKYTHEEVLSLMGGATEENRDAIRTAIARGDLWLTIDWQIKRPPPGVETEGL